MQLTRVCSLHVLYPGTSLTTDENTKTTAGSKNVCRSLPVNTVAVLAFWPCPSDSLVFACLMLTFRQIDGPQHDGALLWRIAGGYRGHRGGVDILDVWRCGQDSLSRRPGSECVSWTRQLDVPP